MTTEHRPVVIHQASNTYVLLLASIAAVGGFLFGFDTAVINGAVAALGKAFSANSVLTGFAVSSALLGSAVGAFFAGSIADRKGRVPTMLMAASEAEPLYMRALAIQEQQLGSHHPSTAISLNNLATLHKSMKCYNEAEPLYVRSLNILTAKLGPNHPTTRQIRANLASLYDNLAEQFKQQGRYDKVVEYLEQAIQLR